MPGEQTNLGWCNDIQETFFQRQKPGTTNPSTRHFFFPNDVNFYQALSSIPAQDRRTNENVMLIIGDGYLLSALPLLIAKSKANIILMCDRDPDLLHHILFYREVLLTSDSKASFLKRAASMENPLIKEETQIQHYLDAFGLQERAWGDKHCFASPENLLACQETYRQITLVPVCIDLFDLAQVKTLSEKIVGKISLLNMTNLREWDKNDQLEATLNCLPIVEQPIILNADHRAKFSFSWSDNDNPVTQARICSIRDYNKTYVENILYRVFIRKGYGDLELCQEIRSGFNHINTADKTGYTPLEIAALCLISANDVRLLLKYGAKIPFNLIEQLDIKIKNYQMNVFRCGLSLEHKNEISEIQQLIKMHVPSNAPSIAPNEILIFQGDQVFYKIGENAVVFVEGDVYVQHLCSDASIITVGGKLIVETVEGYTHLETRGQGDIVIRSIQGEHVRIMSAANVEVSEDTKTMLGIIANNNIKVKNIGAHSYLLAKNNIEAQDLGAHANLVSAAGNIHINRSNYYVCLGTSNADIRINYDPPHGGTISIIGDGEISTGLKGTECRGVRVTYSTKNKITDFYLPTPDSKPYTGTQGTFNANTYGSLIVTISFKWMIRMGEFPIYNSNKLEPLSGWDFYTTILKIFNHTPKSFVTDYKQLSLTSDALHGTNKSFCFIGVFMKTVYSALISFETPKISSNPYATYHMPRAVVNTVPPLSSLGPASTVQVNSAKMESKHN